MLTEETRKTLIEDIQKMDFSFNGYSPDIEVWRVGEGRKRVLPYVSIDFLPTSKKMFASLGDVVGWKADPDYHRFGFCEIELVSITVYAEQQMENVYGRLFCDNAIRKIRKRVLSRWEPILYEVEACLDRSINPSIRDLSAYLDTFGTQMFAYQLDVYLRTNVSWDYMPDGYDDTQEVRAKKAEVTLKHDNKEHSFRIET